MMHSIKRLTGHALHAIDGDIGHLLTFYFNDQSWQLKHLVVDTGNWLPGRKVLIEPSSVQYIDELKDELAINMTQEELKEAQSFYSELPLSTQFELQRHEFNLLPYYVEPWSGSVYPMKLLPQGVPDDHLFDQHLRCCQKIMGYHIQAIDRELGHVEDFLFDERDWSISHIVLNTHNWLPGGKHIMLPVDIITDISFITSKVHVYLTSTEIFDAPEFNIKMIKEAALRQAA